MLSTTTRVNVVAAGSSKLEDPSLMGYEGAQEEERSGELCAHNVNTPTHGVQLPRGQANTMVNTIAESEQVSFDNPIPYLLLPHGALPIGPALSRPAFVQARVQAIPLPTHVRPFVPPAETRWQRPFFSHPHLHEDSNDRQKRKNCLFTLGTALCYQEPSFV